MLLSGHGIAQPDVLWVSTFAPHKADSAPHWIRKIVQDHRGLIWLATKRGVVRYDGLAFRYYNRLKVISGDVSDIEVIGPRLLIGLRNGGLYWFDPQRETLSVVRTRVGDLANIGVQSLFRDGQAVWIAAFSGLYRFDLISGEIRTFNHNPLDDLALPGQIVTDILRADGDHLWIATDAGLGQLNERTGEFRIVRIFPDQQPAITRIVKDDNGQLLIGTLNHGLLRIPPNLARVQRIRLPVTSDKLQILDMLRTRQGAYWLATSEGLFVKRSAADNWLPVQTSNGEGRALTLFEDQAGLIWIGSIRGLRLSLGYEATFGRIVYAPVQGRGLSHNMITGVAEWPNGDILISSYGGLDALNPDTLQVRSVYRTTLGADLSARLLALVVDRYGAAWLVDHKGQLGRLEIGQKPRVVAQLPGVEANFRVNFMLMDTQDRLWIGTNWGVAVFQWSQTTKQMALRHWYPIGGESVFGRAEFTSAAVEASGVMWFGTRGSGLVRFLPEQSTAQVILHDSGNPSALPDNNIHAIALDKTGRLWVATDAGLAVMRHSDSFEFQSVPLEAKDIFVSDSALLFDSRGALWLFGDEGILRWQPEMKALRRFGPPDGVPPFLVPPLVGMETSRGWLVIGGQHGVLVAQRFQRWLPRVSPRVVVTQIRVGDRGWQPLGSGQVNLSYGNNDISLRAIVTDYLSPQNNHLYYRLNPLDNDWRETNAGTEINFSNLPPGNYQLELKGKTAQGYETQTVFSLKLSVAPPIWLTPQAYAIYLLVLAFIVGAVLWLYRRKMARQEAIAEQLRNSDRIKDEFLSIVSHELRTPLTGIIGLTQALLSGSAGKLNEDVQEGLKLIEGSGRRLAALVNEILDFKRLSHRKLHIHPVPVDLAAVVDVVTAVSKPLIQNKPIRLEVDIEDNLPPVRADSVRLQQILFNLVGNAIKFTERGEVRISARKLDASRIRVSVSDTGSGIAPEHRERIFKPFEQIERSLSREQHGSGLGLAITRELVRLHGSDLFVDSTLGEGSTFYFDLSISDAEQGEEIVPVLASNSDVPDTLPQNADESGEQPRVLVVDDEAVNRRVLVDFLRLAGFRPDAVKSGDEALRCIEHTDYDLVILDVMMPRLSGYEVCRRIRAKFSPIELPVLLISARREEQDIIFGLESGANDFVIKPINKEVLLARVKTLVLLKEIHVARQQEEARKTLEQAFQKLKRYFPEVLVRQVIEQQKAVSLIPSRRLITVLFADMQGFTELTDRFEAEVITELLNEFVVSMGEVVERHDGVLNEVLGDGLVVFFGAPEDMPRKQQAHAAVETAVAMQKTMQALGRKWLEQGIDHQVGLRVGIHQDFATVGNIGSEKLMAYRAVGSGVNLAHRLQTCCEAGEVAVSYAIYAHTRHQYRYSALSEAFFKGFLHAHRYAKLRINADLNIAETTSENDIEHGS